MSEVRQIKITGGAIDHYNKEKAGGTRRRRKTQQQDGGDKAPGAPITSAANYTAARTIEASLAGGAKARTDETKATEVKKVHVMEHKPKVEIKAEPMAEHKPKANEPRVEVRVEAKAEPKAETQKPELPKPTSKLTLTPAKRSPKKVILAPPARAKTAGKVRETRKVRVHLSGLKKRLTRAKHISKESADKPIADIRKELEEAKLIKPLAGPGEKVPQGVLRGIHRDYLLLRNRAL
jgi:hypothetical protein